MKTEKGNGVSGSVEYKYNLATESWFGRYECRVNKSLLSSPTKDFCTKKFDVGGHSWQLVLDHKNDGHLAAFLRLTRGPAPVCVHYTFTVVCHADEGDSITYGDLAKFVGRKSCGFSDLAPISEIKNKKYGFLHGDRFTVRLEMRIKLPDNEVCSLSANKNSGVYTWKLKALYGTSPWQLFSDEFTIGKHKWQLEFNPHGCDLEDMDASFFLHSCSESVVETKITLSAVNHKSPENCVFWSFAETFAGLGTWNGLSEFIRAGALKNEELGFLQHGWITLSVAISIQNQPGSTSKQAVKPPKRLIGNEEGPECIICLDKVQTSGVLHGVTTHKCFCYDCAMTMKKQEKNLRCPICREKVERVIEKMF